MNNLSLAIKNLPYAYAKHRIVTDEHGNPTDYIFLEVNPAFEKMTSLVRKDIVGKKVSEVLPGIRKDSTDWIGIYGEVALNGKSISFEQFSEPLQRWYEVKAYREEDRCFTTVFFDNSQRKKIEQTLSEQNRRLKLLLELSESLTSDKKIGVLAQLIVDRITAIINVKSAAIYLVYGKKFKLEASHPVLTSDFPQYLSEFDLNHHPHFYKSLMTNKPILVSDCHQVDFNEVEKEICRALNLRSILFCPFKYKKRIKGVIILASVDELYDFTEAEIKIVQTLASNIALSFAEASLSQKQQSYIKEVEENNRKLKQVEKALLKSQKRLSDILSNLENISFITTDVNPAGPRIIDFSPGAEHIFGYKKEEIIGKEVGILHSSEDVKNFPQILELLKTNRDNYSAETILYRKNGEEFPAIFKVSPLFDDKGKLNGTLGVSLDITERKKIENKLAASLKDYRQTLRGVIHSMGTLMGKRDNYTAGHQIKVAKLAVAIAKELGLDKERIEGLRLAAQIHDLGKISIPAEILTKPDRLTDLEMKMLQTHPETGYEILKNISFPWPLADIVHQHHERIDGSGYPLKLAGDDIIYEAKIICVADVVEAMASHRPYRPALSIEVALAEIEQNKGILYDPDVCNACLKLFREQNFTF